jgi:hypothetical protein
MVVGRTAKATGGAASAVRDVLNRYCWLTDAYRFDDVASLFLEDGVLDTGLGGTATGTAIGGFLGRVVPKEPGSFRLHFLVNIQVETRQAAATATSEFIMVRRKDKQIVADVSGHYSDELVHRRGRWLLRHRAIRRDSTTADLGLLKQEDRLQDSERNSGIRNLLFELSRRMNAGKAEECAALFIEEGIFEGYRAQAARGKVDIAGAISESISCRRGVETCRHIFSNVMIEDGPDEAEVRSYFMTLGRRAASISILEAGRCDDRVVYRDGRWSFKSHFARRDLVEE